MSLSKSLNAKRNIAKLGLAAAWIALSAWGSFPALASKGEGPGVSGGGNAINHQMIEAYVSDISLNPVFINQVSPIFAELDKKVPGFGSLLSRRANEVTWYFIPTALRERTEKQTGLPFDSDQIAVQRYNEVFVDREQFNALTLDSQVKLIVHESVLAAILNSPSGEVNPNGMRIVRLTVNLIAKSNQMTDQQLVDSLRSIYWRDVQSGTELAEEQKKKDDAEKAKQKEERKKKEEAQRNWPVYKPMISSVVNAVKAYCANPSLDTLSKSDWSEISTSTRRGLVSNFQQLTRVVTPLSVYSGIIGLSEANKKLGYTIADVKSHQYSEAISGYLVQDFRALFNGVHTYVYFGDSGWRFIIPWESDLADVRVYSDQLNNYGSGHQFSVAIDEMNVVCRNLKDNLNLLKANLPGTLN
jgi:hypothetical protein